MFRVRRSTSLPECRLGAHDHPENRVVLTTMGGFETRHGVRRFIGGPQRAVYRPAQAPHSDAYQGETECLAIVANDPAPVQLDPFAAADVEFSGLAQRLSTELDAPDTVAQLAIDSLCAVVWERMGNRRHDEARSTWIARVRDRLEDEFTEPPTLAMLALDVSREATYVAATFRKAYGTTIGEYVRATRIWRSRRLVEDAGMPLAEIAELGGFADQSHFTRLFAKRFGLTPAAYRRRFTRSVSSGR